MSRLASFLTALWLSSAAAQPNLFTQVAEGATKEVVAAIDPIEKTVVAVAGSQCSNVKKILGVDYDSYDQEPDLSKLTLNFINKNETYTILLSRATELIPNLTWINKDMHLSLYMHGFTDDPTKDSFKNISSAYLKRGDYNIIALDASSLIRWLYLRSSTMVQFIGEKLGIMLATMVKTGLSASNIHLIGHSLGSHIGGFAGKTFYNLTGQRFGRISGLDPAGPCFSDVDETLRLNSTDADFVDVIHSDAGVYGLNEQVGDVDFYPNSGSQQPDCVFQTCSHSRSWELYAESVTTPEGFIATKCDSWEDFTKNTCNYTDTSLMGFGCESGTTGRYYLQTSGKSPFALGEQGLKYKNNVGIVRNVFG